MKKPCFNPVQAAFLALLGFWLCSQFAGAFSHLHDLVCQETHSSDQECFAFVLAKQQAEPPDTASGLVSPPVFLQTRPVLPCALPSSLVLNPNQVRGPPSLPS